MNPPSLTLHDALVRRLALDRLLGERVVEVDRKLAAGLRDSLATARGFSAGAGQVSETRKSNPATDPSAQPALKDSGPVRSLSGTAPQAPPRSVTRVASLLPELDRFKNLDFESLKREALSCRRCPHLAQSRQQVFFGQGPARSRLMFVVEAPTAEDEQKGILLSGAWGESFDKMLAAMGLSRKEIYLCAAVMCRPDMPPGRPGNRKPSASEICQCAPFLQAEIRLVQPEVVVAMGQTAWDAVMGQRVGPILQHRGTWFRLGSVEVLPVFAFAYLDYTRKAADKRVLWQDMQQVMARLGLHQAKGGTRL